MSIAYGTTRIVKRTLSSATARHRGSAVSFGEACFAPPSGCAPIRTPGLRGARIAKRNVPAAAAGAHG